MNKYFLIIVALVLLLGAIVFFKPDILEKVGFGSQSSDLSQQALDFQGQHSQDFVRYKHPGEKNFSISYPVGYLVLEEESENVTVRFVAFSSNGSTEVINVLATGVFSQEEVDSAFNELKTQDAGVVTQSRSIVNGKPIFIVSVTAEDQQNLFIRHATFTQCTDSNGRPYSATITAGIPEGLEDDLDTVNFMIHGFEC